jgi:hypothetical protein
MEYENADDTQVEKNKSKPHHSRKPSTYIPLARITCRRKNTRLLRQLRSDVRIIILSEWKCLHSNIILQKNKRTREAKIDVNYKQSTDRKKQKLTSSESKLIQPSE